MDHDVGEDSRILVVHAFHMCHIRTDIWCQFRDSVTRAFGCWLALDKVRGHLRAKFKIPYSYGHLMSISGQFNEGNMNYISKITPSIVRIFFWRIQFQCMRPKREAFWSLLEHSDPDIILASGTMLSPCVYESEVLTPNYCFAARKDHQSSAHGGVTIIMKKHQCIWDHTQYRQWDGSCNDTNDIYRQTSNRKQFVSTNTQ